MKKLLFGLLAVIMFLATTVYAATVLTVPQGGTGASSFPAGECLKGNGTGAITTGTCATGGGGSELNWSFFNNSGVRLGTTSNQVLISGTGSGVSTTTSSKLEVGYESTAKGSILALGSTTLQNFTFLNATGSKATTTSIFSTLGNFNTLCIALDCKTAWPTSGTGASTTLLADNNTFTGNNTFGKATTTSFAISSVPSALLKTDANGSVTGYTGTSCTNQFPRSLSALGVATCASVANTDLTNSSISFTSTDSSLSVPASIALGSSGAFTLNLANPNTWTGLQQFSRASSTQFSTGLLYVGATATTTINGTGDLMVVGSTTLQNFTALNSTTSKATTTNLFATLASTSQLFLTTGSNVLKTVNGLVSSASNGTDYTLITATTCGGTDKVSAISASGAVTCTADQNSGASGSNMWATSSSAFLSINPNGGNNVGLGIGTSTPAWALQVASSTRPQLALSDGSLTSDIWTQRNINGNFYLATASPATYATSTGSILTITSNGDATFGGQLTAGFLRSRLYISTSASGGTEQIRVVAGSGTASSPDIKWDLIGTNVGGIYSPNSSSLAFAITNNEVFRITTGNYVGFGTTTPRWQLQLATSSKPQLALSDSSLASDIWTIRSVGSNLYFATSSPNTFATSSKSAFSIDSNGIPTFASLGGVVGCAQFSSTGVLSNTGSACGTGGGSGTNTDKFATSSTDTTLIYPNAGQTVGIGTSSKTMFSSENPIFNVQGTTTINTKYLFAGTEKCLNSIAAVYAQGLEFCGNDNSINGVQILVANNNGGASAWNGYSLNNDRADATVTHFAGFYQNSSTYTDTTFGTGLANKNQAFIQNTDGLLSFISSTSTTALNDAGINFLTGGTASTNERMRITPSGYVGIGTTTPRYASLTIASSTGSQLMLTDANVLTNPWNFRDVGGYLFIATSSPATGATSTVPAFVISPNGSVGIGTTTSATSNFGLFIGDAPSGYIVLNPTATSTFTKGINILGGCFAINGNCLTGSANATTTTDVPIDCNMPQVGSEDFAPGGAYWYPLGAVGAWDFSDATSSSVYCIAHLPQNMNSTPNAYIWTHVTATTSGTAILNIEATTTTSGQNYKPTTYTVLNNASTTASKRLVITGGTNYPSTATSTPVTNTLQAGQDLIIRYRRYGADANDTVNNDLFIPQQFLRLDVNVN